MAALGSRSTVTLAHNTKAHRDGDDVAISLHGHLIVILHADDAVSVRHAGWPTVTTFDRIKRFVPAGWGVTRQGGSPRAYRNRDGAEVAIDSTGWLRLD
jgi:hypothetical protein